MVAVGFEPTKHEAVDLKSTPFDHSGTLPSYFIYNYIFKYFKKKIELL